MKRKIVRDLRNKEIPGLLSKQSRSLYESLWELHHELRRYYKRRWNRNLPFTDEVFDRWERAAFLGFGEGTNIHESAIISGNVKIGKNTWVGPFVYIDGGKEVVIGNNCSISAGVQIYSHESAKWAVSGGEEPYLRRRTMVGDCTYLGANAIIRAGVRIGKYCVVGANSFVNKDIPDRSIVFGTPAKIKGRVARSKNRVDFEYGDGQRE